jgi:Ni/Co efflux regulator RcnB
MNTPTVRSLVSVVALSLFAGTVALADDRGRGDRDDRGKRYEQRYEQRKEQRKDYHRGAHRADDRRRDQRRYHDNDRRDRGRYDSRRGYHPRYHVAKPRFHAGRYHRPPGYRHHAWRPGARLPRGYHAPRYVVRDYRAYRLYAPPRGYHWVRVDGDVVLAAVAGGLITAVVLDLFR